MSVGRFFLLFSMDSSSSGMGALSVSGYIRSAPGSTRSNMVVPFSKDFRVSFGTHSNAFLQRSSMVSRAVAISASGPQKISWASFSFAMKSFLICSQSFCGTSGIRSSECAMCGFSMQAITFSRSLISSAKILPGWVKWESMPLNSGRFTATILFLWFRASRSGLYLKLKVW